jgi:hypothetical protein
MLDGLVLLEQFLEGDGGALLLVLMVVGFVILVVFFTFLEGWLLLNFHKQLIDAHGGSIIFISGTA